MFDFDGDIEASDRLEMFLGECKKLRGLAERGIKANQKEVDRLHLKLSGMDFTKEQRETLNEYLAYAVKLCEEENDKTYYDGINDAMIFLVELLAHSKKNKKH